MPPRARSRQLTASCLGPATLTGGGPLRLKPTQGRSSSRALPAEALSRRQPGRKLGSSQVPGLCGKEMLPSQRLPERLQTSSAGAAVRRPRLTGLAQIPNGPGDALQADQHTRHNDRALGACAWSSTKVWACCSFGTVSDTCTQLMTCSCPVGWLGAHQDRPDVTAALHAQAQLQPAGAGGQWPLSAWLQAEASARATCKAAWGCRILCIC